MSVMDDPEPDEATDPDIRHEPEEAEEEVTTSDPADSAVPEEE